MTTEGFIPPHGGYEQLVTYQKALVIFQAIFYLVQRWVRIGSHTRDQSATSPCANARPRRAHMPAKPLGVASPIRPAGHQEHGRMMGRMRRMGQMVADDIRPIAGPYVPLSHMRPMPPQDGHEHRLPSTDVPFSLRPDLV